MKLTDFRAGTLFGDHIFPRDVYHVVGNIKELRKLTRGQLTNSTGYDRDVGKLKGDPQIFMMVDLTGIIIVAVVISVHSAEKSQIFLALTSIIVIILAAIFTLIHK